MPKKLKNLSVHEVSGVDAAANKRTFLVAKSAKSTPTPQPKGDTMAKNNALALTIAKALNTLPENVKKGLPANVQALLAQLGTSAEATEEEAPDLVEYVEDQESDETLDDLCCALADALDDVLDSETIEDKREAVAALLEQFQEALGAGGLLKALGVVKVDKAGRKISSTNLATLQQIQGLLSQLIATATGQQADDASADGADTGTDDGEGEGDTPDPEQVAMAQMGKAKREARKAARVTAKKAREEKAMTKSAEQIAVEKKMASLEADLKKERDIRLNAEFLQKAKDIGPVPGTTFEKSAALLKSLSESNPEMAKQVEEQMRAAADVARKSALFGEIGKSAQGGGSGSPAEVFLTKAQEKVAKKEAANLADAMAAVAKEEPSAYAEYVNAQRKGA